MGNRPALGTKKRIYRKILWHVWRGSIAVFSPSILQCSVDELQVRLLIFVFFTYVHFDRCNMQWDTADDVRISYLWKHFCKCWLILRWLHILDKYLGQVTINRDWKWVVTNSFIETLFLLLYHICLIFFFLLFQNKLMFGVNFRLITEIGTQSVSSCTVSDYLHALHWIKIYFHIPSACFPLVGRISFGNFVHLSFQICVMIS